MHEKVLDILLQEDEITWQSMILELVKNDEMDPWDVDISVLTQNFMGLLRKMQQMNLRVSGKVVLASAILLKMQSKRFMDYDLAQLDSLIASSQQSEEEFLEELEGMGEDVGMFGQNPEYPESTELIPKTPQPRKRKVSIYDLVEALEKALAVEARRPPPIKDAPKVNIPKKSMDISVVMRNLYRQIVGYLGGQEQSRIKFSELIPSESKEDKVYTFIPLLHLTNQRRVDIEQEKHFSDFDVILLNAHAPPEEEKTASL